MKGFSFIIVIVLLSAFAVAAVTYHFIYPRIFTSSTNSSTNTKVRNCQQIFIEDAYQCNENTRQQLFQQTDCSEIWVDREYCPNGCVNGVCLTANQSTTSTSTTTTTTSTTTTSTTTSSTTTTTSSTTTTTSTTTSTTSTTTSTTSTTTTTTTSTTTTTIQGSKYDNFAKCLTQQGATMYGAYWCPYCQSQKSMFGDSFKYINYVECDPSGPNAQPQLCTQNNIRGYPTWIIHGTHYEDVLSLQTLSSLTGCSLP